MPDIRMPDGTVIKNVPEGTTQVELLRRLSAAGYNTEKLSGETSVLRDVGGALVRGAGQLVSLPGQLAGLVTGDMDNVATRAGQSVEEFGEELQTPAFRERQRLQAERVAKAEEEGLLSGFAQQAGELLSDPLSLAAGIAQTAPAMLGTGGAGLAGRALAGRFIGQQAAKRGALAGAATGEAAIVSGDAAQSTYDRVMQMPPEVVVKSPAYREAIAAGSTPEEAREAAAISAARRAAAIAAPIAAATGPLGIEAALLTGGVRRGLLKGGAEGALREGGTEFVQETGQGVAENIGAQVIDPNVVLTEGLGGRAAAGLILGGTMGGTAGGLSGLAAPATIAPVSGVFETQTDAGVGRVNVTQDGDTVSITDPNGNVTTINRGAWDTLVSGGTYKPVTATEGEPTGEPQPAPPTVEGEPVPPVGPAPVSGPAGPVPSPGPAPAPIGVGPDDTVTVEEDTVIIESPDGTIRVVSRSEWEASQPPVTAPPVAEPVVTPPAAGPVVTETPPVSEPVAAPPVAAPPVAEPVVTPTPPTAAAPPTAAPPVAAPPVSAPPIKPPVASPKPIPDEKLRSTRIDNPKLLKFAEGKTLPQVAEFISKIAKIDTTKDIAGRAAGVLRSFEKAGFNLLFGIEDQSPSNRVSRRFEELRDQGETNLGLTSRQASSPYFGMKAYIGVALKREGGTNEETLTHELVHAATSLAIDNYNKLPKNSRVRSATKDLINLSNKIGKEIEARKSDPKISEYARNIGYFSNPHEVLAWGLTNPEYQAFLKSIPTKSGNAFTDFVKYIGRLLGLNAKDQNALRRLIEISEDILPRDQAGIAEITKTANIPFGSKTIPMIQTQSALPPEATLALTAPPPPRITPTKETRPEGFARKLVDRFERLRVVQSLGQLRAGVEGFYEAARKFDSRAGELMQKFDRDYFQPIQKIMKETGLNLDTVDFYLYARAAPARNARLQAKAENEIRRKMEDNGAAEADIQSAIAQAYADGKIPTAGSGITTQEAEDALIGFAGLDYFPALERIGAIFDRANKDRMENNIKTGLVSREVGERLLEEEPNYVPMKGFVKDENLTEPADDFESTMGYGGTGFGVSVREWYNTRGRENKPFSPLGTFISDVETSIVRGERNRVGQKLMDFFIDNPSDSWRVFSYRNPPRDRSGNIQRPSPYDPNFMVVKRGGQTFYLKIDDPLLAKAAKNLNPTEMGFFLQLSNKFTRLLSRSFTTANPDFFVPNVFRDLQAAALNLSADGPGLAKAFGKRVKDRTAFRTIAGLEYGKNWGDPQLRDLYEQFKLDGGAVSWALRETPEEAAQRISEDLKTVNDRMADLRNARTSKQAIDALWNPTSRTFKSMVDALENTNAIFENGIRFAAYRAALDTGLTREQAAMISREATVDFNRRGEAGALLNALYAFFNAGIQGSVRTARALSNNPFKTGKVSTTQAALLGMMTTAATLAAAGAAMSDEDDDGKLFWDKIPTHEKQRNLIIMHPWNGRTYEKIPMPYGFGFFPYLATRFMDAARLGDWGAAGVDVLTAMIGNFSPIQFSGESVPGSVARAATPTMLKPFTELMLNENAFGSPIYNKPFEEGQSYASSARYNTWEGYKELSQILNDISGGEGKVKGALNFPPESFPYLLQFSLGGLSSLSNSLYRTGEEGDILAAPLLRRFVGQPGKGRNVGEYYEREEKSRVVNQQMKDLTGTERQALKEKFPVETSPRVQAALTSARSRIRKLNEQRKSIQNMNINEGEKAERLETLRERVDGEYVRFNRIYNDVEQAAR